jgi:hypothetical protein
VFPIWAIFLFAGGVCPVMAVVAMFAARMPADEIAHPLDRRHDFSVDAEVSS